MSVITKQQQKETVQKSSEMSSSNNNNDANKTATPETRTEVAHWLNQRDETTFSKYDFVGWILFYIFYLIVHVGVLVG